MGVVRRGALFIAPLIVQRLSERPDIPVKSSASSRRAMAEGTDIVINSPREFAAEVKAELEKWRGLVKRTGMKF